MRTTLISSVIAASVLTVGFAATAGAASSDGGDAAVTPTTAPFSLDGLGLTPEQMTCLTTNVMGVDINDMAAVMTLMTQCGIDPATLGQGVTAPTLVPPTVAGVPTPPTLVGTPTVDPAVAASVLLSLGIDPASAACIRNGLLAATAPGNDTEALTILQSCGLTLNNLLIGVLALEDLAAGAATTPATFPVVPTVPAVPTTGSGVSPDNPLVQQLIDLVRDQYGIELTPAQASCLLDNIGGLDPNDLAATMVVMEQCGISVTDLTAG